MSLEQARSNRFVGLFDTTTVRKPSKTGLFTFRHQNLETLLPFIDWTFFFHSWRLNGKYPQIFDDPVKGNEARKLYDEAQMLLKKIVDEKLLTAHGVAGIFPANSDGDDVIVFSNESRKEVLNRFSFLRNQQLKPEGIANLSLADFIAPLSSGVPDYIGGFVVTAGHGTDALVKHFEAQHDDYNAIMAKVLADRLGEAFAEYLHVVIRKDLWGYAPDEQLSVAEMLREEYRGIRRTGISGLSGTFRKTRTLRVVEGRRKHRCQPYRTFCHVSDSRRQRILFWSSRLTVF